MDKRQIIEAIQALNEHAESQFLNQFEESDLAEYLKRLEEASTRKIHLTRRPTHRREYRMVS